MTTLSIDKSVTVGKVSITMGALRSRHQLFCRAGRAFPYFHAASSRRMSQACPEGDAS